MKSMAAIRIQQNWNGRPVLFRSVYIALLDEGNGVLRSVLRRKFVAQRDSDHTLPCRGQLKLDRNLGTMQLRKKMGLRITYIRVGDNANYFDHGHGPCRQEK